MLGITLATGGQSAVVVRGGGLGTHRVGRVGHGDASDSAAWPAMRFDSVLASERLNRLGPFGPADSGRSRARITELERDLAAVAASRTSKPKHSGTDSVPPPPGQSAHPNGAVESKHIHKVVEQEQDDSFVARWGYPRDGSESATVSWGGALRA